MDLFRRANSSIAGPDGSLREPHHPRALIALRPSDRTLFFEGPTDGLTRLLGLLPEAEFFNPSVSAEAWNAKLAECEPDILVTGWRVPPIPAAAAKHLRYICHVGGSVRSHVPRSLIDAGVQVTNWGACIADTVAEAALLLVLSALRRSHFYAHLMHAQKGWREPFDGGLSLFGRRVGIHGFGAVVRELVPLLRPFRPTISVFTTGVPEQHYAELGVRRAVSLRDLFATSDVLIELEALREDTRGSVTEDLLRTLPPDAVFVNLARGPLVDEAALNRVAAEGAVRIALDVFGTEPLPAASPLREFPEVVLIPHQGGPTRDRAYLCGDFALQNLERYLRGEPLIARVTAEIYDRAT